MLSSGRGEMERPHTVDRAPGMPGSGSWGLGAGDEAAHPGAHAGPFAGPTPH